MTKWLQIYFLVEHNSKKYNSENIFTCLELITLSTKHTLSVSQLPRDK